ncbi:MAG TPA: hypothetical protein VFT22_42500 [Kofleriaceae bacterium]|nr:hypothetical protein [Kofleriaceae bacterium]
MSVSPGFNATEAETLIAIAAQLEGASPPLPPPPIPSNWTMVYDSQSIGPFDNRWQLWQDTSGTGDYAAVIRGTTSQTGSILEDLLAVMVPASGSVTLDDVSLSYQLAADPLAGVHLGFALGTLITLFDPAGILLNLASYVPRGHGVFIAGHSQGAAMATLCRSFLHYSTLLSDYQYSYKSYVFAQPKPGNDHYGDDYDAIAGNLGTGFTVNNNQDWVPQVPFTFELYGDLNVPNVISVLGGSPPGLAAVQDSIASYRHHQAQAALARQAAAFKHLAAVVRRNKLVKTQPAPAASGTSITILPTLNFVGAGAAIALQGTPGTNPDDPKDGWWQHHAAMYYQLLQSQLGAAAAPVRR